MANILLLSIHGEYSETSSPNIGISRLAHYLDRNNVDCDVCEIGLCDSTPYLEKARLGQYKFIGVTCTYVFMEQELETLVPFFEVKKEHSVLFAAGGQCPSSYEELWLKVGFDLVMHGYGEKILLSLAQALQTNEAVVGDYLKDIPGISFIDDGKIIKNIQPQLSREEFHTFNYTHEIEALEKRIPAKAYWSEVLKRYRKDDNGYVISLFTSQHCPNRCGYCNSSSFLEFSYGKRKNFALEAEYIVDLVCRHNKRGIKNFYFPDDDFGFTRKRFKSFCEEIIKAKKDGRLTKDVAFQCQTRVVAFSRRRRDGSCLRYPDEELIRLASGAGFCLISLGVENFCERLLHTPFMNKFGFDDKLVIAVVNSFLKHNICPNTNFMMCVPDSKPEEIIHNTRMLMKMQSLNVAVVLNVHIYSYPGARVFTDDRYTATSKILVSPLNNAEYEKKGHFIPHDPHVKKALEFYLERGVKEEIAEVVKRMGDDFFYREAYLLNLLKCRALCKKLPKNEDVIEELGVAIEKRLQELSI